jgi:CelD/BcsL family acetyltransferase involved in cellulose biosynthesis
VPSQERLAPYHRSRHRSPVIDLRDGADAYLAAVRAQSRDVLSQVARRRRKLEREVAPLTCEWNRAEPADLTTLLTWKSDQYRRTGVWDRFAEPWIERVVRALAEPRDAPLLEGVLTTLHAGDRLVAAHFGLRAGRRLSWWFPAYDPELGRYSPGLVLLLDLVGLAPEHGVDVVDLGRGEHHYKVRVANASTEVAEGVVPAG